MDVDVVSCGWLWFARTGRLAGSQGQVESRATFTCQRDQFTSPPTLAAATFQRRLHRFTASSNKTTDPTFPLSTHSSSTSLFSSNTTLTMPVPPDESVPADAPSSSSRSGDAAAIDDRAAAQEVLEKFKQLGREAQEEGEGEGDGSDEEDEDEEGAHGEGGATGGGGVGGGVGGDESGKKKKKKKKKGKASKAVAKLK